MYQQFIPFCYWLVSPHTPVCFSIYQLTDVWVVSTFWLLWTMPLWAFMYKFLHRHMFLFHMNKHLGGRMLVFRVGICLTFDETINLFCKVAEPLYSLTSRVWEFQLHILNNMVNLPDFSHPGGYIVVSWDFSFHFPNDCGVEHLFTCLEAICPSSLVKGLKSFAHLFLSACLSYYCIRINHKLLMSFSRHMSCNCFS